MRIDYGSLVNETRKNKKNQFYEITKYLGKKGKKHYFNIKFVDSGNIEMVTYNQIKAQTCYDTKVLEIERRNKKVEQLKARNKRIKGVGTTSNFTNFTKDKVILALDLATIKTGVTVGKDGEVSSYLLEIQEKDFYKRLHIITDKLLKLVDSEKVEKVVLEDVWLGLNSSVLVKLVTVRAFIIRELIKRDIEFQMVSPTKWRAYYPTLNELTREELKMESIRLYKEITGKNTSSDDLAESRLIYEYVINNCKKEVVKYGE